MLTFYLIVLKTKQSTHVNNLYNSFICQEFNTSGNFNNSVINQEVNTSGHFNNSVINQEVNTF